MNYSPKENNTFRLRDGRVLGYAQYGDPKGKPVFFFHGWPGSRFSGKETDDAGKKIGARIISTDRPGIGLSTYKKDRKLLDWPDDVVELADHMKIKKFSLLGVSGGGPYVAVCAYKIPERIIKAGIVVGLAPVDVKGNLDGMALQSQLGFGNYHKFPLLRTLAAFGAALQFAYFPLLGQLAFPTKEDKQLFNKSVREGRGEGDGIKGAFRQGIRGPELELKIYTDDWGFKVKDIKAKVYLWYGAKDKCVSINMGKYYNLHIKGSKLFIDPDGVHLSRYKFEEKILKKLID
ncbi:MAG: alpha/beta hydrolase [Patescibacteria group bacterium]|nr:alpha/beta hydrolase [Patescibacteria group bacterium]